MEPEHAIFAKDYVKPRICSNSEAGGADDADMVENVDGWFDGLPIAKHRRGAPIKLAAGTSAAAEAAKLQKLQAKHAALQAKIQQQQQRVRSNSHDQSNAASDAHSVNAGSAIVGQVPPYANAKAVLDDSAVFEQPEQLPLAGMGGPNIIGNESDDEAASSMAGLSMSMADNLSTNRGSARENGRVPKSLVKTRRERKNDTLMTEAGQRTQAALQG